MLSGVLDSRQLSILWEQIKELLAKLPGWRVALLAEGGLQGWRWSEMAENLPDDARRRLLLEYSPDAGEWRSLLHESAWLACPMADMSVAQRLLECMACETPMLAGATSLEFLKPGHNALGFRMFRNHSLLAMARAMLEEVPKDLINKMAANARADVLRDFDQQKILPGHVEFVLQCRQRWSVA